MSKSLPTAYEGADPFAFVSYCHKDSETVLPVIGQMAETGIRAWYDSGINPGSEWPEVIADHLESSASFIAFVSEASLASHNCRREFNFAVMENKPSLIVFIEEVKMTPVMKMQMATIQAVKCSDFDEPEKLADAIRHAQILQPCLSDGDPEASARKESGKDNGTLVLVSQPANQVIDITRNRFMLGRKAELCDYTINDPSVSREHAILRVAPDGLYIIDNDSLNGTYVNGVEIDPNQLERLEPGDRIELGDAVFIVKQKQDGKSR